MASGELRDRQAYVRHPLSHCQQPWRTASCRSRSGWQILAYVLSRLLKWSIAARPVVATASSRQASNVSLLLSCIGVQDPTPQLDSGVRTSLIRCRTSKFTYSSATMSLSKRTGGPAWCAVRSSSDADQPRG